MLYVFPSKSILPTNIWLTCKVYKETSWPIDCWPNAEPIQQRLSTISVGQILVSKMSLGRMSDGKMSNGQIPFFLSVCWPKCLPSAKCLSAKSLSIKCLSAKCLSSLCLSAIVCWPIVTWPNISIPIVWCTNSWQKCLLAKCFMAKYQTAKCLSANCLLVKWLLALISAYKISDGQINCQQSVSWLNVSQANYCKQVCPQMFIVNQW